MFHKSTLTAALVVLTAAVAVAQNPVTYVDADSTGPGPGGVPSGNTADTFLPDSFDFWTVRDFGIGGDLYEYRESNGPDPIELATTISGLTPGTNYNFYAFFWDDTGAPEWFIDASLGDANNFVNYNAVVDLDNTNGPVFEAATLPFVNIKDVQTTTELTVSAPGVTLSIDPQLGINGDDSVRSDGGGGQDLFAASLGSMVAPGNGEVDIFIRNISAGTRVWYDGVGFQEVGGITGDTNGDGDVDLLDYNEIASRIGGPAVTPGSLGDVFGDGIVDLRDFAVWSQNRTDLSGTLITVPEPSTLTVALLAGLAACGVTSRRFA